MLVDVLGRLGDRLAAVGIARSYGVGLPADADGPFTTDSTSITGDNISGDLGKQISHQWVVERRSSNRADGTWSELNRVPVDTEASHGNTQAIHVQR